MNLRRPARSCLWEVTRSTLCSNDSLVIHGAGKKNHRLQKKKNPHPNIDVLQSGVAENQELSLYREYLIRGSRELQQSDMRRFKQYFLFSHVCIIHHRHIQRKSIKTSQRLNAGDIFFFFAIKKKCVGSGKLQKRPVPTCLRSDPEGSHVIAAPL